MAAVSGRTTELNSENPDMTEVQILHTEFLLEPTKVNSLTDLSRTECSTTKDTLMIDIGVVINLVFRSPRQETHTAETGTALSTISTRYGGVNYTCGLDGKYRVLVSVVCLSVCLCVSTITQKINGLGS